MKKKWAVWKTILIMVASVFVVAGVTVAAVLLNNGGSGDIYPEDLSFETDEQPLFRNNQFEITENDVDTFTLTITSTTQNVTNKRLELTFPSDTKTQIVGDTITDYNIIVPHYVTLGEPFKIVKLYSKEVPINSKGETKECIVGGISRLIARSVHRTGNGYTYKTAEVKIAVDTPVENIEIQLFASEEAGNAIDSIDQNKYFYARAHFYPQNSEKIYSGDGLKNVYYGTESAGVNFEYDSSLAIQQQAKFKALIQSLKNKIVAYTFRSADLQEATIADLETRFEPGEQLYRAIFGSLLQGGKKAESEIEVTLATVTGFTANSAKLKDLHLGQAYTLRLQNLEAGDDNLGAMIYGADGEPLNSMLPNVAVAFFKGDGLVEPISDEDRLIITDSAGNALQYVENEENVNGQLQSVRYYLPCTDVNTQFLGASYWRLFTDNDMLTSLTLKVVLLKSFNTDSKECELYNLPSYSPSITIDKTPVPEADIGWQDEGQIDLVLPYKPNGTELDTIKLTIDSNWIKNLPAERKIIFFGYFGTDNSEEADAKAQNLINANCLELEHAGNYNLDGTTRRLYPFVLQGQSGQEGIIIKAAGSFTLYFASVKTQGQHYEFDTNGLYQILDGSKGRSVVINEMLNENSIASQGEIRVEGEDLKTENTALYIYPGQNATFAVTVGVNLESWQVFKLQYKGLNFSVYSGNLNISNYFTIGEPTLSSDDEHKITYTFTLKTTLELRSGNLSLTNDGFVVDKFKFNDSLAGWEKSVDGQYTEEVARAYIYQPSIQEETSTFATDSDISETKVIFTLFNDQSEVTSELRAKITAKFAEDGEESTQHDNLSEGEFIDLLKKFVKISDIHGNDSYFSTRWSFATDSPDLISINGQSFTFKYQKNIVDKTAKLYIICREDGEDGKDFSTKDNYYITLHFGEVEGKIVKAEVNGTSVDKPTRLELNRSGSIEDATINFKNLITLYTDDHGTKFDQYKIRFDGACLTRIGENRIKNLFGSDGMLKIDDKNYENISELSVIKDISVLYINKNFAQSEVLNFIIYDDSGIINIALDLTIGQCFQLSGLPDRRLEVYAGIDNPIGVNLVGADIESQILGTNKQTKYIHQQGNVYVLSDEQAGGVGKVFDKDGTFTLSFDDFWNNESRSFTVTFGDSQNYYALSFTISYDVKRNIAIIPDDNNKAYVIAKENKNDIWEYFNIERIEGQNTSVLPTEHDGKVIVKTDPNGFFKVDENGELTANAESTIFKYGQLYIAQMFEFLYKDETGGQYSLANLELKIEPGVTLEEIAQSMSLLAHEEQKAAIVTLDNQQYLYLQANSTWAFNYQGDITINPTHTISGYNQRDLYTVTGNKYDINVNSINSAIKGRGESDVFLIVKLEKTGATGKTTAYMFVPMLLSNLGMNLVNYTTDGVTDSTKSTLDNAFADFDTLLQAGVYQEIEAGKAQTIIQSVALGNELKNDIPGFVYLEGLSPEIRISTISAQDGYNFNKFSKLYSEFDGEKIQLNHLDTSVKEDVYLALQIYLSSTTFQDYPYNFLLKVIPDVTTASTATYAYNGEAEYVTGKNITINLDETFDAQTLHNNEKRFNVTGTSEKLPYTYEMINLVDDHGSHQPSYAQDGEFVYSGILTAKFAVDNATNSTKLTLTTDTNNALTFTFRRVYQTIIGANGRPTSIEYTIKLNSNAKYQIKYGDSVSNINGNNAELDVDHTFKGDGQQIDATLYNGETAEIGMDIVELSEEESKIISSLKYENNKLTIVRADYVSRDIDIPVTFYTKQGYLGTLTLHVKASGKVNFENTELTAGKETAWNDLKPTITLDGQTIEEGNYTITRVQAISANGQISQVFDAFDTETKTIKLNSLVQDTTLTLEFTLMFDNNECIFEQEFNIRANVTSVGQEKPIEPDNENSPVNVSGVDTIAGSEYVGFEQSYMFTMGNGKIGYTLSLKHGSGDDVKLFADDEFVDSNLFISGYKCDALPSIKTFNVSQESLVEILIKVDLMNGDTTYQSFYVKYSFNIYPNRDIQTNYPDVGSGALNAEYIEDGARFANVDRFVNSAATFANANRFTAKSTKLANGEFVTDSDVALNANNNYTLSIVEGSMQNITIETENGVIFSPNATTFGPIAGPFTFHFGVKREDNYDDLGRESQVTLRLTCNEVFKDYVVIVRNNVYSLQQNLTNIEGGNNTELLYIDYYSGKDEILAENRLLKVTFKNSLTELDYRIVWLDDENNEHSTPLTITKAYQNQTKIFDLGGSARSYIGIFNSNAFNGDKLSDSFVNGGDYTGMADDDLLADGIEPQLLSRIQLLYADQVVNYDKFKDILLFQSSVGGKEFTVDEYEIELQNITDECVLSDFYISYNNGQLEYVAGGIEENEGGFTQTVTLPPLTTFVTQYTYRLDIDITADDINVIESTDIEVGKEITSILTDRRIRHKSNDKTFVAKDFADGNVSATLSIIDEMNEPAWSEIKAEYPGIEKPYADKDHPYLLISSRQESWDSQQTQKGTDFRLLGNGASNQGNYVLLKFTCSVKSAQSSQPYEKDFYFVYKVIPDYQITFSNDSGNTQEEEYENYTIPSNRDHSAQIDATSGTYTFTVASKTGSDNDIVTINHSGKNENVATKSFKYKLVVDDSGYNLKENVQTKLGGSESGFGKSKGWQKQEDADVYEWTSGEDNNDLEFSGIEKVVFAEQNYRLLAEDNFGYKFYVYFTLKSSAPTPSASGTLNITEGESFDIGAQFELLEIVATDNKLDITSKNGTFKNDANVKLVTLESIEAWGFNYDYTQNSHHYLDPDNNNYKLSDGYSLSNEELDGHYLIKPQLFDINVSKIAFYKTGSEDAFVDLEGKKTTLATVEGVGEGEGYLFFANEEDKYRDPSANYIMPNLPSSWFTNNQSIEVTMAIELTYSNDASKESVTITTKAVVSRQYTVTPKQNLTVHDGEEIALSDILTAKKGGSDLAGDDTVTYYDDTLKVTLPANNQSVTLKLSLKDEKSVEVEVENTHNFPRTQYISLSEKLGSTLNASDTITVEVINSGNRAISGTEYNGYYIEYGNGSNKQAISGDTNTLEIESLYEFSDQNKEQINIENPTRVENNQTQVTKHYLAVFNGSDDQTYRVSQSYNVVPYYYSLSPEYGEVKTLDLSVQDGVNTIQLNQWATDVTVEFNSETKQLTDLGDGLSKLYFVINDDEHSSGAATIDESGVITTTESFKATEYIAISIYVKISGVDGKGFDSTDISQMKFLGQVRIRFSQSGDAA